MSQLTIATTEVNLKIDVMLSYADDNVAPPTNTIVSDFIKNFPSDDMTKVQTELSEGTAAQVDQINKDLAEFWDGDQVDDLNTQLDDATKPMTDMQEQLDEVDFKNPQSPFPIPLESHFGTPKSAFSDVDFN